MVDGVVMEKLGEGHPPLGAAMARSRWRNSYVTVSTLLKTKKEFYRPEASERSDEGRGDRTMGRWCGDLDDMARIKPWRIPQTYSFCHASSDEWMRRNWEV